MSVHRCARCKNDGKFRPVREYQVGPDPEVDWIYLCGECVVLIVTEWHKDNYNPVLRRYSPQRSRREL